MSDDYQSALVQALSEKRRLERELEALRAAYESLSAAVSTMSTDQPSLTSIMTMENNNE